MEEKKDPKEFLKNLENDFKRKITFWNNIIDKLSNKINDDIKYTLDLTAEATSQRQILIEERTHYYFTLYKNIPSLKLKKKELFEWYSSKYQFKTNGSEKTKLIEADMSYFDAKLEYIQNYINFLTETLKTIDNIIYSTKNKIDLYNITGLD